jgi:hypothetical protein
MMKRLMILSTAALLLASCGGKNTDEGQKVTVADGEGGTATVNFGGDENGIAAPENLPAFAPVYPGAVIQSAVTGNEGEAKGMVSFITDAKQAEVLAFYKDKGKAAGMSVKAEVAMGTGRMLAMGAEGESPAMQITATPGDDGKVQVAVVYDGGKPG